MKKSAAPYFDGLEQRDLLTAVPLWSPSVTKAAIIARLNGVPGVATAGNAIVIRSPGVRPGAPAASNMAVIGTIPDIESDLQAQQLRLGVQSDSTLPPLNKPTPHLNLQQSLRPINRPI